MMDETGDRNLLVKCYQELKLVIHELEEKLVTVGREETESREELANGQRDILFATLKKKHSRQR